ncbi:LPD7 domain-containing protein [Noviherbaspirillum malthae]|uniref:LPD7 domain-containing protein n=1 Tax=Noviherbaspirillum malthae TaxID=1260987 RepID=UPI00188E53FA|nr:LPD7 domain-containing protein [Noviherbaspirillum malthae]
MIIRQGGGNGGIIEYLEHGRKAGRLFTRDELDERVPLAGDAEATRKLIKTIEHAAEKYLHLILSFAEKDLPKEVMKDILDRYVADLMAAYRPDEYLFYAEAHYAKIKSSIHETTGEHVDRLDHIHLVIPNLNLLSGKALNPIGRTEQNIVWLDALQEAINRDYKLVSPKDRPRADSMTKANILGRDRVTEFKTGSFKKVKQVLEAAVVERQISNKEGLIALAKEYGEVRVRNQGKGTEREYVAVKPPGFDKWVNLSSGIFRDCMGAMPKFDRNPVGQVGVGKRTDDQLDDLVDDWVSRRSREIKLLNSGRKKEYAEYKAADSEIKMVLLGNLEKEFYRRYDRGENHGQNDARAGRRKRIDDDTGKDADADPASAGASASARAAADKSYLVQFARGQATPSIHTMPSMHARGLDRDARGGARILQGHAGDSVGRQGRADTDGAVRFAPPAGRTGRVVNERTGRAADNYQEQLLRDHIDARACAEDGQGTLMNEIKRRLDPDFLLAQLAQDYGVRPEEYVITEGSHFKDAAPRIRHRNSTQNANVADFLTRHIRLSWPEASRYLQSAYTLQNLSMRAPITPSSPNPAMWRRYQQARRTKRFDLRPVERATIRAAKVALRQLREQHQLDMEHLRRRRLAYADFRAQRSLLKMQVVQEKKRLQAEIRAARERIAELDRTDPARAVYRGFLMERAQAGDVEALLELRCQRIEVERRKKPRGSAFVMMGMSTTVALVEPTEKLSYKVRSNGDVSYFNGDGVEILRDTSNAIYVMEQSEDSIELALLLAQRRFGNGHFDPLGDDAFNERVVQIAAERNMSIRFHSKEFNDKLERMRAELHAPKKRLPDYCLLEPPMPDGPGPRTPKRD